MATANAHEVLYDQNYSSAAFGMKTTRELCDLVPHHRLQLNLKSMKFEFCASVLCLTLKMVHHHRSAPRSRPEIASHMSGETHQRAANAIERKIWKCIALRRPAIARLLHSVISYANEPLADVSDAHFHTVAAADEAIEPHNVRRLRA